ncbi:hypothetical protein [Psychrobacter sp. DAB_AL32B]|uniref:hypothetical protein n=1 Tax=Psychrobacter sp. DAB_AL32B TaxID=1028414 RepID=UPI000B7CD5A4|nr:hypothetical protein [Psychrobacter sp. DAB_AL32B]OXL24595.1 hypothetical protein CAN34_05435 [Psychrobacter sp. DAB_AL32B]
MQKTLLSLTTVMSLLVALSGCQPKVEMPTESNDRQKVEQNNKQPLSIEQSKPAVVTEPAIDAKICLALSKSMEKIDDTSKIEAIYAIQKSLKSCLPTASNAEVLRLLKDYQAMYERFLLTNETIEDKNFNIVMEMADEGKKVPEPLLKTLNPRLQYLIRLVEDDADVRVIYLGEGYYEFTHDLQAMADIFTPYLRQDQKAFIERMAMDNQKIFWFDAAIAFSLQELIERAQFWEDYLARYPKGYAHQDAKYLFEVYRYLLLFGSENTQWTDDSIHEFVAPEYRPLILKLARRPNSVLARDAQALLGFIALSDSQRQEKYPTSSIDEDGDEMSEWVIARYQKAEALPLQSPWETGAKNCMNGIFCVENDTEQ